MYTSVYCSCQHVLNIFVCFKLAGFEESKSMHILFIGYFYYMFFFSHLLFMFRLIQRFFLLFVCSFESFSIYPVLVDSLSWYLLLV
eukprot:m.371049 g.371049  ORF g.371049 m.371049 type:complete len:86 (-) comp56897_c0_seq1:33-290(-)